MNRLVSVLWRVLALGIAQSLLAGSPPTPRPSSGHGATSISLDQIEAIVGRQYSGDGLAVVSSPDGAMLRCALQRLNARITSEGLWLVSTVDGAKGEPFRVIARTLGREDEKILPLSGRVALAGQMGRFIR